MPTPIRVSGVLGEVQVSPTQYTVLDRLKTLDASVNAISVGGGTQYTEGDIDATFTGTIAMAEGPSNTATPLQVDASNNLQVDIAADSVGIGGGTQYAIDAVAGAADTGTLALLVRDDALAALTPVDGDYTQGRTNSRGAQWVIPDGDVSIDDGGNSITVDGTVGISGTVAISAVSLPLPSGAATAAKQLADGHNVTVDNASIAVTGTFFQATQPVSVASLPLPSGASTAANQLADGHNVTVDNGTGASAVNIRDGGNSITIDGTVGISGTVTVDLGSNNDVTIDGSSIVKAEDSVHSSGDDGVMALFVRQDSQVDLAADGDYIPATVNAAGELRVTTGAGTPYTEDVATANPIVGTATMMERDDVLSALTPVAGDWVSFRSSAEGALWVQDFNSDAILADTANMDTNIATIAGAVAGSEMQVDIVADGAGLALAANQLADGHNVTVDNASGAAAVNIQDGGNSITIDGTVAISGTVPISAVALPLPSGAATSANQQTDALTDTELRATAVPVTHGNTSLADGVKTVTTAGTDVALAGSTAITKVIVQAQTDNTSLIAVGGTGVDATEATGTGVLLYPGDTATIETDNLADVFIDSLVNGEGVRFTYFA